MLPGWRVDCGLQQRFQHRTRVQARSVNKEPARPGVLPAQRHHVTAFPRLTPHPSLPILPTKERTRNAFYFSSELSECSSIRAAMRREDRRQGSSEGGWPLSTGTVPSFRSLAPREGVVVMPAALDNLTGEVSPATRTDCLESAWLVAVHHSPEHSAGFVTWSLAVPPPRPPLCSLGELLSPGGCKGALGKQSLSPP